MVDDIDFGGGSGAEGPFLSWMARASQDGTFSGKCWIMRSKDGKDVFGGMATGVVFDIEALKLGWCQSDGVVGVTPNWKWNASITRFEPKPGDDFKRGFSIPIATSQTEKAVWEQAQAGAFSAMSDLFTLIKKADRMPGHLPVVKHVGETKLESKKGMTFAPILQIVKWVPRPMVLSEGHNAAADFGGKAAPVQAAAPKEAPEKLAAASAVPF